MIWYEVIFLLCPLHCYSLIEGTTLFTSYWLPVAGHQQNVKSFKYVVTQHYILHTQRTILYYTINFNLSQVTENLNLQFKDEQMSQK